MRPSRLIGICSTMSDPTPVSPTLPFSCLQASKPFLVSRHVVGTYVEGHEELFRRVNRLRKPASKDHPGIVGKEEPDLFGDGSLVERNQFRTGFMRYLWHPNAKPSISDIEIAALTGFLLRMSLTCSALWHQRPISSPAIETCWLISQAGGDYSVIHTHSPALISGVFYLATPPGINAKTFPDGILSVLDGSDVVAIPPIAGLFLVWPGKLPHMVYPFRGRGRRVLLSWNLQRKADNLRKS